MNDDMENQQLKSLQDIPNTESISQKVILEKISGLGTGVWLAGGAILGCFALALWNRRALSELVRKRGQPREWPKVDSPDEDDAIY